MTHLPTDVEFEIPQKSGEALCLPPARQFAALARRNAALLTDAPLTIAGVRLADVRRRARTEVLQAAKTYALSLDLTASTFAPSDLLLVTGHQPFLFHPGIWLKHLLIDRLVGSGMGALSMPVDNDVAEDVGADVPRLEATGLRLAHETLVRAGPDVPYEAVPAPPLREWREFVDRLQAHLQTVPLPDAQASLAQFGRAAAGIRVDNIGMFLTAARRRYEGERRYAELPVSKMSAGVEFKRFVLHLLRDAERFAAVYNHHLDAYRERYNIRTAAQPFPDLQREGDRQELPFWIIRDGRRAPLSVQRTGSGVRLVAAGESAGEVADGDPGVLRARAARVRGDDRDDAPSPPGVRCGGGAAGAAPPAARTAAQPRPGARRSEATRAGADQREVAADCRAGRRNPSAARAAPGDAADPGDQRGTVTNTLCPAQGRRAAPGPT